MSLELNVTTSTVPSNLECIITDTRWQQLVALLSVIVPDGSKVNVGSTAPAPADRIYPWLRLDPTTGKPERLYYYTSGYWLSMHQTPAESPIRLAYADDTNSLKTYDGGEDTPVSDIAGPFWTVDTDFAGRIPIGVGDLPSFSTSGNTIVLNTNDGNDQVTLVDANYKNHRHFTLAAQAGTGVFPTSTTQVAREGGGMGNENYSMQLAGGAATVGRTSLVEGLAGTNEATEILNPVRGVYWIKRTKRLFYRQNA